jgi:curved DNA-binding protein CbpA
MVPDAFSLLDLPRRPWLDADLVRQAFQQKAAALHPDRNPQAAAGFAALTRAHEVLREPGSRLLAYLGEAASPGAALSPELVALFPRIAAHREKAQRIEALRLAAGSRLGAALLTSELAGVMVEAKTLLEELDLHREALWAGIREIDARLDSLESDDTEALRGMAHRLAFVEKWRAQLVEALLRFRGAA